MNKTKKSGVKSNFDLTERQSGDCLDVVCLMQLLLSFSVRSRLLFLLEMLRRWRVEKGQTELNVTLKFEQARLKTTKRALKLQP